MEKYGIRLLLRIGARFIMVIRYTAVMIGFGYRMNHSVGLFIITEVGSMYPNMAGYGFLREVIGRLPASIG